MTYLDIICKVAEDLNLSTEVVDKAYKGYWTFIRDSIQSLPLKEVNEEEFNTLKTNFNIPSLGKLSCNKERWIGVKKRYEYINNLRKDKNAKDN